MLIRFLKESRCLLFYFVFLTQVIFGQDSIQNSIINPHSFVVNELNSFKVSVSFSKIPSVKKYIAFYSLTKESNFITKLSNSVTIGDTMSRSAKICFLGHDSIFVMNGLNANQSYWIYIASVVDSNGFYLLSKSNPLEIEVRTPNGNCDNYYNEIIPTAPNFIQVLTEKINIHKVISYVNYKSTLVDQFEMKDTLNGVKFLVCSYTGEKVLFNPPFDWNKLGLSREHTYAHSWMPSYPANSPAKPEYSDLHNLYVTNLDKANAVRNNHPFGEVTDSIIYEYKGGRLGYNKGKIVYEPRDSHKGNVARAIFYMSIAYNGIQNLNWKLPASQDQELLKRWHFEDLPDNYEIARHEYIYNVQGNRNPFIDSVQFACYIDFSRLSAIKNNCKNVKVNEITDSESEVIEFKDNHIRIIDTSLNNLVITDLSGKLVLDLKEREQFVDISNLSSGFYLVFYQVGYIPKSVVFMK